ncbi:MAG: DUF3592 domain-containing protein, partial [Gammaproteobacteria bacterium]|nr:DUF3592 domain-containing protein [Gammaproteobacteria bacterium]
MRRATGKSSANKREGYWGGMLFGLVFIGVGAAFLLLGVIPNLWDVIRMQDWVQVPAEVVAVDLESNSSDGSTTYKVTARFSYNYYGRQYTCNRVGIADGGADNVGDWQHDTYARLKSQDQTTVWVNTGNPSEAIFDRDLRWDLLGFKLIFVIVFGGFGTAMLWYLNRKVKPVPPGLPAWQARAEWVDNRIRSNARSMLWVAWGFAIFWNAISSPIPFVLPGELAKGNQLALVGLIFPLVGLGLVTWAIRQTLNWRRFGTTPLKMDPFPGALGGDVGGAVELRLGYNPKYRFRVTLTCHHVTTRRTSDGSETVRDAKWQDEQLAEVQPGLHGTRLRFLFKPPGDLPESSAGDASWYEWNVQISASLPGTDFDRSWEVPVFKEAGPQTARDRIEARALEADSLALPDAVVRIRETGAGLELYYPYLRNPGMALGTLVTGGGFVGFAWLFHMGAGNDGISSLFIGLFAAVGVLIIILGLYLAGNSLRVTAGRQGLNVVRGILGMRLTRHVAAGEIAAIEKSIGMQSRQGYRV